MFSQKAAVFLSLTITIMPQRAAAQPSSNVAVTLIDGVKGIARLMAQSAVQPGVASLVSQLLQVGTTYI